MTGKRAGYYGFGVNQGQFVADEESLAYVLEQCGFSVSDSDAPTHKEAIDAIKEWFFSGAWVHVREGKT